MANELRSGTAEEAGLDPSRLDKLTARCESWIESGRSDSLVVLIARRGVVAHHEAYGRLSPEPDARALTVDDIYPISSVTKPFTATAIMMLTEEGLVEPGRAVTYYIPEMKGTGAEAINLVHLLTHTSGYTDDDVMAFLQEQLKAPLDLPPLPDNQHKSIHLALNARYQCRPSRPPNELMSYCGYGYDLLAEIVRRVSGQGIGQFLQERVFTPLLMTDTSFHLEERFNGRMVKRRPMENPFGADMNDDKYLDTPWGSGGMNSCALDLARFGQLFLNQGCYGGQQILSRSSVMSMTSNHVPPGVPEDDMRVAPQGSYGFGWFVLGDYRFPMMNGILMPRGSYAHAGMGGSLLWVDPLNELVGVVLNVWQFEAGATPGLDPPILTFGPIVDMATAAVI